MFSYFVFLINRLSAFRIIKWQNGKLTFKDGSLNIS